MVVIVLLGSMLLLAFIGIPLVFALLGASIITISVFLPNTPIFSTAQLFVNGMDKSLLQAIVFFFFAGELMNRGGITRKLVALSNALIGFVRGGLGHVNILTSIFFSGISGAAVADTAAVGSVLIPSMIDDGYSRDFSAAVTETSSVIGPIIPPSIPMIVYATMAKQSVGKMFIAGIIPGLVVAVCLMVVVAYISKKRDYPKNRTIDFKKIVRTFRDAAPAMVTPFIIVGGILGGVFTATEAGAIAAIYSLIIGFLVYHELTWREVWISLIQAARGTAAIMIIVGASTIFAFLVARLQVSKQFAELLFSVSDNPYLILLMINVLCLIIGLMMDPLAAIIILVPVLIPTVLEVGIDPIHFGVVLVLNLMIGLVTPPVGYLIYMSSAIAKIEPEKVIKESIPFLIALFVALIIVTLFPSVTLTLPGLMK